jgi:hypothetical protein
VEVEEDIGAPFMASSVLMTETSLVAAVVVELKVELVTELLVRMELQNSNTRIP